MHLIRLIILIVINVSLFGIVAQSAVPLESSKIIRFSIINNSVHELDWVSIEIDNNEIGFGVLPRNVFKARTDHCWKYSSLGSLSFIDAETRKTYVIPLSFTAANMHLRLAVGKALTIRILDYDKAEVVVDAGDHHPI